MAQKIKIAGPYFLILVLVSLLIGFNFLTMQRGDIWKRYAEADTGALGTSVSVGNVDPVVSNVCVDGSPRGSSTITLVEDIDIDIVVSATVTDSTCDDINGGGVKAYVFVTSASWDYGTGTTCSWDYNDCYVPESAGGNINCVQDSCSNGVAVYSCSASGSTNGDGMWYHASPTGTGASYSAQGWYAMVIATDSAGGDGFASNSAPMDVDLLTALSLGTAGSDSIAYGSVTPGSESSVVERGVENTGNRGINITVAATTTLEIAGGGATIASEQQEYSLSSFNIAEGEGTSLSATPTEVNVDLPKPISHVDGANDDQIFWGIAIPGATLAGVYSGQTTYTTNTD